MEETVCNPSIQKPPPLPLPLSGRIHLQPLLPLAGGDSRERNSSPQCRHNLEETKNYISPFPDVIRTGSLECGREIVFFSSKFEDNQFSETLERIQNSEINIFRGNAGNVSPEKRKEMRRVCASIPWVTAGGPPLQTVEEIARSFRKEERSREGIFQTPAKISLQVRTNRSKIGFP